MVRKTRLSLKRDRVKKSRLKVSAAFFSILLIAVISVSFSAPLAHAQATLVQQNNGGCGPDATPCSSLTLSVSFGSSVTSGDVIVVGVYGNPYTVSSVSDSLSSSFTRVATTDDCCVNGFDWVYIYSATLAASGTDTVTVTFAGSSGSADQNAYIYEVSGVTTAGTAANWDDGVGVGPIYVASVNFQTGAFLVAMAGASCFQGVGVPSFSQGAGFSLSSDNSGTGYSYAQYATSGISSPTTFLATIGAGTCNVSPGWAIVGVAFNPVVSASTSSTTPTASLPSTTVTTTTTTVTSNATTTLTQSTTTTTTQPTTTTTTATPPATTTTQTSVTTTTATPPPATVTSTQSTTATVTVVSTVTQSSTHTTTTSVVCPAAGANLQGANLAGANLQGCNMQGDNLQNANLQGANLQSANLQGANLQGANLQGASANGANFQGANLQGDNLSSGSFVNDNFQGANLQSCNLSNGNFSGANFTGANLKGVTATGAIFTGATNPP